MISDSHLYDSRRPVDWPPSSEPFLDGDGHSNLMKPSRTVWSRILLQRRLDLSRSIGRTDQHRVTARRRHRTIIAPEVPRIGRTRRLKCRCSPMPTIIYADLDQPDSPCACKGESLHSMVKTRNGRSMTRQIDSRHRLHDGVIGPTLPLIVALIVVIHDLDFSEPLHAFHPVVSGHNDAGWKPMALWERHAVHPVRDQHIPGHCSLKSNTVRESIGSFKDDIIGTAVYASFIK